MKHKGKHSIPFYGPLNIEDDKQFLKKQKEIFKMCYPEPCPFEVKLENFALVRFLGEGGFGKVILVKSLKSKTNFYAMKSMKKSYLVEYNFVGFALNEKRVLQSINFPFCVSLVFFSQDKANLYFFLPFISGGELFKHLRKLKKFDEDLAKFYAAQVVLALEYLHFCDLVYRDLKPENILIDHLGYAKVTDFGFTKILTSRTYTFCGTPEYIAPEIILGHGYGKAIDYWSLGVLIFEMVNGISPFSAENEFESFKKIIDVQYEIPEEFSKHLTDLVSNLLQEDVTRRYGNLYRGIDDIKHHKWFKNINWLQLLNRKVTPPYVPTEDDIKVDFSQSSKTLRDILELRENEVKDYDEYFKDF